MDDYGRGIASNLLWIEITVNCVFRDPISLYIQADYPYPFAAHFAYARDRLTVYLCLLYLMSRSPSNSFFTK
jgi:hypothetical protein